jgi:uroporphyrinogen decarboxylase
MKWDVVPKQTEEPDFKNLLAVLRREMPSRPTLFEFFLNDRLYQRLAPELKVTPGNTLAWFQKVILAFKNAGYDYATFLPPGFDFPSERHQVERTVSINAGAVIKDRASFKAYRWKDPEEADFGLLEELVKTVPKGMRLIGYGPGGVLENAIQLVGYEPLCYLIADDEKLVADVFNEVGARLLGFYERLARYEVIGACIGNDDWGYKTQTMLSPKDLRRYVFPWYKRINQAIHSAGKPAILHSCGHFERIIDDIVIDMQFDARHSFEDTILPVEEAYERYQAQIAILGGIDVDFVCRSTPEAVYRRSRGMLERTEGRGGYALGTGNSVPDYVPDGQYFAMIRAALDGRCGYSG